MSEELTQEKANKYMEREGQIRGTALRNYADFILADAGEEALKKVEKITERVGHPIKYRELKEMSFYPLGYLPLTVAAIREALGYGEEKLYRMGGFVPKVSIILKLFLKFFVSLDRVAREAPKIWEKYYTVGSLKVSELNEKEKYLVLDLKGFSSHPLHCSHILSGYFAQVVQMILGQEVTAKEVKCPNRGDSFHQYHLEW
ncbi:MAG: hypothetical protein GF370_01815 [Candidatus Nealsonbacteria bacterium]|nr:hypothetical protein [Candidatus Nealsonbacteria bacterium]